MSPSSLPPRKRDTRTAADRIRQDRENLKRLGVGYVGGRFPSVAPLGATAQYGDLEDDEAGDDDAEDTQAIAFNNTDRATATGAGIIVLTLTYPPIDGSLHIYWNGLEQPPTEWTLSGRTVTFPDHLVTVGDVLNAAYAYQPADAEFTGVDWGSSGANLIVAEGSTVDYSAPDLNTAGWTVAAGPVGYPLTPVPGMSTWLTPVLSSGSANSGFWLRRTVIVPAGGSDVTISCRTDGQHWLYVDGELIHSYTGSGDGGDLGFSVSATLGEGERVIALHINDDTGDGGSDHIYGDLSVTTA